MQKAYRAQRVREVGLIVAKGTILLFFLLSIIASLLIGINVGKKISRNQNIQTEPTTNDQQPTTIPSPTLTLTPTITSTTSSQITGTKSLTTYTDKTCGFSFSYPGSFINQQTVNEQSIILADPDDENQAIAATCAEEIPKPPLPDDKIEQIILDEIPATLYHDTNAKDGSPRIEVIVKHPTNNLEIIIAGYGTFFQQAVSSFRFIKQ